MSDLLLELYSEEIPALLQKSGANNLLISFTNLFKENNITFNNSGNYSGPCRITIYFSKLKLEAQNIRARGPMLGMSEEILDKFCNKYGVSQNDLTIENQNGKQYFYLNKTNNVDLKDVLLSEIPKLLSRFSWPKSMRWGSYQITWVRPLKSIMCLFNGQVLPLQYGHITAGDITFGHKFFAPGAIKITSKDDYRNKLLENYVIISERESIIKDQLDIICNQNNWALNEDHELLMEVAGLVEYPTLLVGEISNSFMHLPAELLILCLKVHQRYFTCKNASGAMVNKFIFASNCPITDFTSIIAGNQRVLNARLSDALYFYNQDLKKGLEAKFDDLSTVVFHQKLGTMQAKVLRLEKMCKHLKPQDKVLHLAARFCKCDLLTEVVKEFPELQGTISKYYASNSEVGEIIAMHYFPKGLKDSLPGPKADILSIVDKLDTLVGLLLAGEKVTSSKDPYGIRRNAISILRVILESELVINLKDLIEYSISLYREENDKFCNPESLELIQNFILDKFDNLLEQNYNPKIVQLILKNDLSNISLIKSKINDLEKFYHTQEFKSLVGVYKRIYNISSEKCSTGDVDPKLFITPYEKKLFKELEFIISNVLKYNLSDLIKNLLNIIPTVNDLFDNVLINVEDELLAQNRLNLVVKTRALFEQILNFSTLL